MGETREIPVTVVPGNDKLEALLRDVDPSIRVVPFAEANHDTRQTVLVTRFDQDKPYPSIREDLRRPVVVSTEPIADEQLVALFNENHVTDYVHFDAKKLVASRAALLMAIRRAAKIATKKHDIVCTSPDIPQLANKPGTVLITGETGTGKSMLARVIHEAGTRSAGRFVVFDCAGATPSLIESDLFGVNKGAFTGANKSRAGVFEEADGGTIFIDEIGDLSLDLQKKLLGVLQNHSVRRLGGTRDIPVNIRVIAATHRDLKKMVERHEFREDLYYRLNVFQLQMKPLRERKDDIPLLVRHFLLATPISTTTAAAIAVFQQFNWPGNIRQLEGAVLRAVSQAGTSRIIEQTHVEAALNGELGQNDDDDNQLVTILNHALADLKALVNLEDADQLVKQRLILGIFQRHGWTGKPGNGGRTFKVLCEQLKRIQRRATPHDILDALPASVRSIFIHQNRGLAPRTGAGRPSSIPPARTSSLPPVAPNAPSERTSSIPPERTSSLPPVAPNAPLALAPATNSLLEARIRLLDKVTEAPIRRIRTNRHLDKLYVPRDIDLHLRDFLETGDKDIFIIVDVAGAGKTAVMATSAYNSLKAEKPVIFLKGADLQAAPSSAQVPANSAHICHNLIERAAVSLYAPVWNELGVSTNVTHEHECRNFWESLNELFPPPKPLVIMLDAINEFHDSSDDGRRSLKALLHRLSGIGIKFVLSCRVEFWDSEDHGFKTVTYDDEIRNRLFIPAGRDGYYGSGFVADSTHQGLGTFTDSEFERVWEKYRMYYRVTGTPILEAREVLRHPLYLFFFCKANEGRHLGRFSHANSNDVLCQFAADVADKIAKKLTPMRGDSADRATRQFVEYVMAALAWEKFKGGRTWIPDHEALRLLTSYAREHAPPQLAQSLTTGRKLLECLVSEGVLRRNADDYKFSFDVLREYLCGTWLAKQRSFDERTIPGEVLWMQQLHARGYLQVVEILRHAVLNRELWSDDYVVLLEWMAQSHPDLQEAACTTIAELAITQAPSTAQSSVAVFSHVSESRRQSERLQNLLGLPPPQLGNGALGSEPTRPARMSELRRIFERIIDPLPERKDFTIRFVLSATLEIMCQAMQDDIWPFIQNWCEPKRIFTKRTLALSVLPAFGMRRRVVDQIKELFISDHEPQFWVRRSAAEAMVELLRQKKKPVNVSDEMHADEVFNEFNAVLSARINQIPNDALSTIERAMLLENQIYLHAAVHRPPATHTSTYMLEDVYGPSMISCLLAFVNIKRIWTSELGALSPHSTNRQILDLRHAIEDCLDKLKQTVDDIHATETTYPDLTWPWTVTKKELLHVLLHDLIWPSDTIPGMDLRDEPAVESDVAVVFAPEYFSGSLRDHPECKERIYAVLAALDKVRRDNPKLFAYRGAELASPEELCAPRCDGGPLHDRLYLKSIEAIGSSTPSEYHPTHLLRALEIRPGSWEAARRSAGALIRAAKLVLDGKFSAVFCPSRPPGHLAGNKICIFDNLAVAVLWIRRNSPRHNRIFVFDMDAHHGRHVQESFYDDPNVFYASIHEEGVHPGQGFVYQVGRAKVDSSSRQVDPAGLGTTLNLPLAANEGSAAEFLTLLNTYILPAAERFQPDIVMIAGGLDGDARDPFSNLKLHPHCFYDTVRKFKKLATRGIIVSLEGGYHLSGGLPDGTEAILNALTDQPLRQDLRPAAEDTASVASTAPKTAAGTNSEIRTVEVFHCSQPIDCDRVQVTGSVASVLSSSVQPSQLVQFGPSNSLRYGIGAGSTETDAHHAYGDLGELFVAGGKFARAKPSTTVAVDMAPSAWTPFCVGWHSDPKLFFRIQMKSPAKLQHLLETLSLAFDCPVPLFGFVGFLDLPPDGIREKRLIKSPVGRSALARENETPYCLTPEGREEYFQAAHGKYATQVVAVGFCLRVGHASWGSRDKEHAFSAAATYGKAGAHRTLRSHVHFAEIPSFDSNVFTTSNPSELARRAATVLLEKPTFVSHLELESEVHRATFGVVPLIYREALK